MKEEFNTLTTPHFEKINKNTPWNEYPRPSMKRDSFFCLNGEWDFAIGDEKFPENYSEKILVPFPPESLLSGIQREIPVGKYLFYKRTVCLPEGFVNKRLLLHFGAVDTVCDVYINSTHACHHEGGYLPFYADITELIGTGEFEICVRVLDSLDKSYPYGKQKKKRGGMWYTPVSGIWQTVWLESVCDNYISKIVVTPTLENVKIEVIGGVKEKKITLLQSGEAFCFSGDSITLAPSEIKLWTPEEPYIYDFSLECGEDRIESYFAMREIKIGCVDGIPRILVNGNPTLFSGLLDQGYYPDGIFLPPTSEGYRDDILLAKRLGFNMLRKHIKIEPEIFYEYCDRLGIFVFQDMVNNSSYSFLLDTALPTVGFKRLPEAIRPRSKREREIFTGEMIKTIEHLHNFPSVVYYTIFNEGWGQFSADKMYNLAKECDKTRIIDSTSGWFIKRESDVDSRHVYFKAVKLKKTSSRPIVISEFGGYSHRVEGHLFGKDNYGYRIFDNESDFENALISLYKDEILPLIPLGISGLVYTQLSDVEDETNGLITYDRRHVKIDEGKMLEANKSLYNALNK